MAKIAQKAPNSANNTEIAQIINFFCNETANINLKNIAHDNGDMQIENIKNHLQLIVTQHQF